MHCAKSVHVQSSPCHENMVPIAAQTKLSRNRKIHAVTKAYTLLGKPNLARENEAAVCAHSKFKVGKVRAGREERLQSKETKYGEVVIANKPDHIHR